MFILETDTKEKKRIIKRLKSFWEKHQKVLFKSSKEREEIEKEMNETVKGNAELGFFYVDGECCGIGASDYADRKKFPLIHDTELEK